MIVADNNLIAYLLIEGPFTVGAQKVSDLDQDWFVPQIWHHEFINVLATSARAKLLPHDIALELIQHSRSFVTERPVDLAEVVELSIQSRFATYDCYYVVLARKLRVPLVTADKKLLANFNNVAVSIEDFAAGH